MEIASDVYWKYVGVSTRYNMLAYKPYYNVGTQCKLTKHI
jgi:hypothetical protein